MAKNFKVVGFDPGTAVTGWSVLTGGSRPNLLGSGAIRATAKHPIEQRLQKIYLGVLEVIDTHTPDIIAIEDPFVGKNANGALTLGQARGVILLAAAQREIPVSNYSPRTIKLSVTGRGAADKEQVRQMVTRMLNLDKPPQSLDVSDAIAVALCHLNRGELTAMSGRKKPGSKTDTSGTSIVDDSSGKSANKRAEKLAARGEDSEALARWLSGGRKR